MLTAKALEDALIASICKDSFGHFVEYTSGFKLHPWQWILCNELQRWVETDEPYWLLVHAPSQVGKSQIVTKRLPAWIAWRDRLARQVIAAYSKTQATKLVTGAIDTLTHPVMLSDKVELVKSSEEVGWWTKERKALADGQPSFMSVGLDSGFTGTGADYLYIDDPYASAFDARSQAVNNNVQSFWTETAMPRVMANKKAKVLVVFHRYHENDICGFLQKSPQSHKFKMLRFPAIADGLGDDPTGREIGEPLSPFHDIRELELIRASDPKLWAGQYQGLPLADGERLFEPSYFAGRLVSPEDAKELGNWYRGVDTAFSTSTYSDESATARVAFDSDGNLWIRQTDTKKVNPGDLVDWLERIAEKEGHATTWVVEQHNAGYAAVDRLRRLGFPVWSQKIQGAQGSKLQRAFLLHELARNRKVFIVKEGAYEKLMTQLYAFTGDPKLKEKDDLIDAISVVLVRLKESKSHEQKQLPPNRFLQQVDIIDD